MTGSRQIRQVERVNRGCMDYDARMWQILSHGGDVNNKT
jgi:hypothetical protein